MFSGIIESVQPILESKTFDQLVRIKIQRPQEFQDIKNGDSIAVNGVCLTVENFDERQITFALAYETLKVLGWVSDHSSILNSNVLNNVDNLPIMTFEKDVQKFSREKVNLERSLRFGDRIHGHLVSGHVDSLGEIVDKSKLGESLLMNIRVSRKMLPYLWKKGSITVHGVSLTVNEVSDDVVSLCLIPETQLRTNLSLMSVGDKVTIETDFFAKAMIRKMELKDVELN